MAPIVDEAALLLVVMVIAPVEVDGGLQVIRRQRRVQSLSVETSPCRCRR